MNTPDASSPIHAHLYSTPRTARYYTSGGTAGITQIWVALHGYGMLPAYWMRKLAPLASPTTLVVAPEGLSRFYLDSNYTRVGASWMTREDRQLEVADYICYLDGLYAHILQQYSCAPHTPLRVLGFSQGAATAWRWMCLGSTPMQQLAIWAGTVPTEEYALPPTLPRIDAILGLHDEYISPDAWQQQIQCWQTRGIHAHTHTYVGKHQVHADTLRLLTTY